MCEVSAWMCVTWFVDNSISLLHNRDFVIPRGCRNAAWSHFCISPEEFGFQSPVSVYSGRELLIWRRVSEFSPLDTFIIRLKLQFSYCSAIPACVSAQNFMNYNAHTEPKRNIGSNSRCLVMILTELRMCDSLCV